MQCSKDIKSKQKSQALQGLVGHNCHIQKCESFGYSRSLNIVLTPKHSHASKKAPNTSIGSYCEHPYKQISSALNTEDGDITNEEEFEDEFEEDNLTLENEMNITIS